MGWREDEMVEDADEKTGKGCAMQLDIFLQNVKRQTQRNGDCQH